MPFAPNPAILGRGAETEKPNPADAVLGNTKEKTLLGDFIKRMFDDPDIWQHLKEDAWFGYEDNVMDAYRAGKISAEELPDFLKRARRRDKLLRGSVLIPHYGLLDGIVSQLDNRLFRSELSKPRLLNRSSGKQDEEK